MAIGVNRQRNTSSVTSDPQWMVSSRCAGNGSCVEVAMLPQGDVWVRDGKNPVPDAVLIFTRRQWDGFLTGVTSGEFVSS
jgi:Domain of unknown function (DUF397)